LVYGPAENNRTDHDLLTIYSDLWLANKMGIFSKAGDHFYFKSGTPNSWADGNH
jgi:hypothetical protein